MPQHIWIKNHTYSRRCEVCAVNQRWNGRGGVWMPDVHVICPGDDEDDGSRASPRRPMSPDSRRPVLDDA